MNIFCGECSQCSPSGQEPAHTPHCMHIFTHWPSSTFSSTSRRKLLRYWSMALTLRSFISASRETLHRAHPDFLNPGDVFIDEFRHTRDVRDGDFIAGNALGFQAHLFEGIVDLAHAVTRQFRALDEMALVIVAVFAAQQHHAVPTSI